MWSWSSAPIVEAFVADAIHRVFDVSVLFAARDQARNAFTTIFKTPEATYNLSFPNLHGFAQLIDRPMPSADLDLRRVGEDFAVGEAYVALTLGILDQVAFRLSVTNPQTNVGYPDPWEEGGRLRIGSLFVGDLLALGGHGVVLHKAAATVKTPAQFSYEVGDAFDSSSRPFLAWLDTLCAETETGGIRSRSFGMLDYYGLPNVEAGAPGGDPFSLERTMQAVKYACGRTAVAGDPLQAASTLAVPLWFVPGRRAPTPAPGSECLVWTVHQKDNGTMIELRSDGVGAQHPSLLWNLEATRPGTMPFEVYARAVCDQLARRVPAMVLVDFPRYTAAGSLPARVLCFERARELAFYATAGFGRLAAPQGTNELATAHAEFCLYGPAGQEHQQALAGALLNLGGLAHATTVPGGLKDWDGAPGALNGWGILVVPCADIPLSPERPIALRLAIPITAEESAMFRGGGSRQEWYTKTMSDPMVQAARWAKALRGCL